MAKSKALILDGHCSYHDDVLRQPWGLKNKLHVPHLGPFAAKAQLGVLDTISNVHQPNMKFSVSFWATRLHPAHMPLPSLGTTTGDTSRHARRAEFPNASNTPQILNVPASSTPLTIPAQGSHIGVCARALAGGFAKGLVRKRHERHSAAGANMSRRPIDWF